MALKQRYDGKWLVRIRMAGKDIRVVTPATGKRRAREIDRAVTAAIRYNNFSLLDKESRAVCVKLFKNQGWPLPAALFAYSPTNDSHRVVPLWDAIKLTLESLQKQNNRNSTRHEQAFIKHIGPYFGKDFLVTRLWVPEIQDYLAHRLKQGASGSTVNKDLAALSKMFTVLIEHKLVAANPARMVKPVAEGEGREVYVSHKDLDRIVSQLPYWMRPIIQALYYTGMRRGECLGLKWENVNLDKRIIRLWADQTKEGKGKRVPIHRDLVPLLQKALGSERNESDLVFLIDSSKPPSEHSLRKPWKHSLDLAVSSHEDMSDRVRLLTIHDLRHTWKGNAMRSGMDEEIRKAIMGHSRGIAGRYGRISDKDLVQAIDGMNFDHGETEIWVAKTQK